METIHERQTVMGDSKINPMFPDVFRVKKVRKETYDTFTFEMESANGGGGLSYAAGQFNMLYVFGVGEVPISISGDPGNTKTLVHTIRAVGTVTKVMKDFKRGDAIGVRGPYGTSWPLTESVGKDVIIVAGGIGLAPLRPSIYQILSERTKYGKVILLYGARTPEDLLYLHELEHWRARFDLEVHVTVDRAAGEWQGNVGVVTTLIPKVQFDVNNAISMLCGPEIMMRFTVMDLQKRGLQTNQIYVSNERNMKCGIGLCGHCQFGPTFVCKDGPVFRYDQIAEIFTKREI
jgi:NAD(P)H-flavin reductase